MREIKFRGKTFSCEAEGPSRWVFGTYAIIENTSFIVLNTENDGCDGNNGGDIAICCNQSMLEVFNNTVGQFTGLQDKNGKDIYDGDKIRSYHQRGIVIYHNGSFGFFVNPQDFLSLHDIWERGDGHKVENYGSIHDNPELLEVTK